MTIVTSTRSNLTWVALSRRSPLAPLALTKFAEIVLRLQSKAPARIQSGKLSAADCLTGIANVYGLRQSTSIYPYKQ